MAADGSYPDSLICTIGSISACHLPKMWKYIVNGNFLGIGMTGIIDLIEVNIT